MIVFPGFGLSRTELYSFPAKMGALVLGLARLRTVAMGIAGKREEIRMDEKRFFKQRIGKDESSLTLAGH